MSVFDAVELSHWQVAGRLGLALGLGSVIGIQREVDGHDAGVRTHALLTLGSALFGVLSVGAFGRYVAVRADSNVQVDVTRIASYLVAGVGFLAGGSIVKHKSHVRGLTTAASMWVAAAVGLAAGLGFFIGAVVVTVASLAVLLLERPLARLNRRHGRVTVHAVVGAGHSIDELIECAERGGHRARGVTRSVREDGALEITFEGLPNRDYRRVLAELERWTDVREVSFEHE